jgi:hypothetical protein
MPAFPWQFFIGAIAALGLLLGGVHIGRVYERAGFIEADLTRAEKVIVKVKTERVIEERVVTKWRDREKTIVINAEEIKHEIPVFVRPDCVLPADFIVQLHAISRNVTVASLGLTEDAGKGAGCRAALDALRRSYENHYLDAAQLNAILDREKELEALDASP